MNDDVDKPATRHKKSRRLGDNSITLQGVIDRLIVENDLEPYTRSTFFVRAYDLLRNYRQNIQWSGDEHGIAIYSLISRRNGAGTPSPLFRVQGYISRSLPPLSQVRNISLLDGLIVPIGEIKEAAILTGQNINMRLFEARVTVLVNCNTRIANVIRMHMQMSQYNDFGRQMHRMDTLYIKILYYALMRQRFDAEGLVPMVQPFQVDNRYHHFNTRPDVDWDLAEIDLFKTAQSAGWVAFVGNEIHNPNDVIFYQILGSDVPYFVQPAGQRVIPALHWIMPAIDLFSIGPNPAIKVAARDIPASASWEFARRLATYRGETQTFTRALYYVSELVHADALPVPMDQPNINAHPKYNMHLVNSNMDDMHIDEEPPQPGPVPVAPRSLEAVPERMPRARGRGCGAINAAADRDHNSILNMKHAMFCGKNGAGARMPAVLQENVPPNVLTSMVSTNQLSSNTIC